MKPIERYEIYIKSEGISITASEAKCGIANGTLRKAISKKAELKSETINKILIGHPNLDADWFVTGRGVMNKLNSPTNFFQDFIEDFIEKKYGATLKGFVAEIEDLKKQLEFKNFVLKEIDGELIREIKAFMKSNKTNT